MDNIYGHGIVAGGHRREVIYRPDVWPGYVAWLSAFDYGGGRVGISFTEIRRKDNYSFKPPSLEAGEAAGAPVSYCSAEFGGKDETAYKVYMASDDGACSFYETGRCRQEDGSFCNVGFPDGRILGIDAPLGKPGGTDELDGVVVRESRDGGATWRETARLLQGAAPYLWRAKKLSDGTVVVLASFYGTPWGPGKERRTRNTMLPGESYIKKIQTFFLTSSDGFEFSGPHYILPGVGAHEYDFVEAPDGSLLFIAGDVQATPVARQFVERRGGRFINGTLYGVGRGAPVDAVKNPQGGFVPETLAALPSGLIVGARRGKPYSCSADGGENWYEIDGLPVSLYQPCIMLTPDGSVVNFGHFGGDNAFGEVDMYIGADYFTIGGNLPAARRLELSRCLSKDGGHYENRYAARLTERGAPAPNRAVTFRFSAAWSDDGSMNTAPQGDAPLQINALTDADGHAWAYAAEFDQIPDIHHYYNVDVIYSGDAGEAGGVAVYSPMMCCASLTPRRERLFPHIAYFAEGTLFLSPDLTRRYPDAPDALMTHTSPDGTFTPGSLKRNAPQSESDDAPPDGLIAELIGAHALILDKNGGLRWYRSVHCPKPLVAVREMPVGDWYV